MNSKKLNLKRKVYSKGKKNFKRFKKTPKFVRDNPENQIAREKERDAYHFTDSDDSLDDLGMGLELSDLPFLDENLEEKQKSFIALTQDTVRPLFANNATYDEQQLDDALAELKYKTFRPNQKEAIKRILFGRSTLFISPTGSGKSLCYQLPALLYWRSRKYITIVVSPLISLMEDQMNNFPCSSLTAVSLHSGHAIAQRRRSIEKLIQGEAQVAFISPEAIVGGVLNVDDLKSLPPVGFVCIDEAHCLSEWSHNFRPAYQQFYKILSQQMNIKVYLGLTATATRANSIAIANHLNINPDIDILGSTTIPENLILSVSFESEKETALINLLKSPTFRILTSIIVYCNRREDTEHVASRIRTAMQNYSNLIETPERKSSGKELSGSETSKAQMKLTWHAEAYHAGLSSQTRNKIQRQFIKGELRVVVATIAFGMGINKSNVRAIIHYDMPSSFESYVQEIGRAGRDGKPAQCHMFLKRDKSDLYYQQRNIYSTVTGRKNLKKLTDFLFKPCRCHVILDKEGVQKLEELNKSDPHMMQDWPSTHADLNQTQEISIREKAAVDMGTSNVKRSVVAKHRACQGHELAFEIEQAVSDINLKAESIITFLCQLQRAYPQLRLEQFTPTKSTCTLFCYHGPEQMKKLANVSAPIRTALRLHQLDQIKQHGSEGETPSKISFNVIAVAAKIGKPSSEVIRMLKRVEWELVEKTGKFRRSQARVNFEGNSFHLKVVGDMKDEEIDEVYRYLLHFTVMYEMTERQKLERLFSTFKSHCIEVEKMKEKEVRLDVSSRLKNALQSYFDQDPLKKLHDLAEDANDPEVLDEATIKRRKLKQEAILRDTKAFLSAHSNFEQPRDVARIFQGISTPNYPAEHWGMNKKWWRLHPDVDFIYLSSIVLQEILRKSHDKVASTADRPPQNTDDLPPT